MQEIITVGISGADCTAKKAEIEQAARERGMSLSRFMVWLYEQFAARQTKKVHAGRR